MLSFDGFLASFSYWFSFFLNQCLYGYPLNTWQRSAYVANANNFSNSTSENLCMRRTWSWRRQSKRSFYVTAGSVPWSRRATWCTTPGEPRWFSQTLTSSIRSLSSMPTSFSPMTSTNKSTTPSERIYCPRWFWRWALYSGQRRKGCGYCRWWWHSHHGAKRDDAGDPKARLNCPWIQHPIDCSSIWSGLNLMG